MLEKFGITEKQILTLSEEQLATSIGKNTSITLVNKKVSVFNETILNVLSNYITDETLTCDAVFRLLFETHFAINMLSSARLLVCCL